jgi:hypothetical protein
MEHGDGARSADEILDAACRRLGISPVTDPAHWPSLDVVQDAFWHECTTVEAGALLSRAVRAAIIDYVSRHV